MSARYRDDGAGCVTADEPTNTRLWKVVWANGDEVYVPAEDAPEALLEAAHRHGPTKARVIYCRVYGRRI